MSPGNFFWFVTQFCFEAPLHLVVFSVSAALHVLSDWQWCFHHLLVFCLFAGASFSCRFSSAVCRKTSMSLLQDELYVTGCYSKSVWGENIHWATTIQRWELAASAPVSTCDPNPWWRALKTPRPLKAQKQMSSPIHHFDSEVLSDVNIAVPAHLRQTVYDHAFTSLPPYFPSSSFCKSRSNMLHPH